MFFCHWNKVSFVIISSWIFTIVGLNSESSLQYMAKWTHFTYNPKFVFTFWKILSFFSHHLNKMTSKIITLNYTNLHFSKFYSVLSRYIKYALSKYGSLSWEMRKMVEFYPECKGLVSQTQYKKFQTQNMLIRWSTALLPRLGTKSSEKPTLPNPTHPSSPPPSNRSGFNQKRLEL